MYDFSTLNDKEFEQIVRDLLNAEFSLGLQSFKTGKDKGIDLRYSTSKNTNSIVVQVKHYVKSKFSDLLSVLKNDELEKVKTLNPDRYLVATSLPLSAAEKDKLQLLLAPFVITANDIFGQEDLNTFLLKHKDIETKYFKLWFSSNAVHTRILNNAIEARTKFFLKQIYRKISFYVITPKLDEARKILIKEKLLLITGQPGIGKTTLAEILLCERAKKDFKIYKVENIREAEDVISVDDKEKQIFYFDDFLGANYLEIVSVNKTESQITSFVQTIKNTPNKYLILTTRTVILNHAIERHEKIGQLNIKRNEFEIRLTDYSLYEKAQILYNHLYFQKVPDKYFNSILKDKFYNQIIAHRNYTPRIIEFITDVNRIRELNGDEYRQFVLNNLSNPQEIWRFSFNKQIDYFDKCLLLTIFSLGRYKTEGVIQKAFDKRLKYERQNNYVINPTQFSDSLKILLNGFLSSTIVSTNPVNREISFINPSLADFLLAYVRENFQEHKGIISSLLFYEQLEIFKADKSAIVLDRELQETLKNFIEKDLIKVLSSESKYWNEQKTLVLKILTLIRFCSDVEIDKIVLSYFIQIDLYRTWQISSEFQEILTSVRNCPKTQSYIRDNFRAVIAAFGLTVDDYESAKLIPKLFRKYGFDFDSYTETHEGFNEMIAVVEKVLESYEESIKSDYRNSIGDISDVEPYYEELSELEHKLKSELFPNSYFDYDFNVALDKDYWEEKIKENEVRSMQEDRDSVDDSGNYFNDSYEKSILQQQLIEDLFSKNK